VETDAELKAGGIAVVMALDVGAITEDKDGWGGGQQFQWATAAARKGCRQI
jgi:hypothetical protein